MKIDWFTLAAQIVNFLILLFLLRHFLFKRILRIMDERREEIENRYSEVEEEQKKAEQQSEKYQKLLDGWEKKKAELFEQKKEELAEFKKNKSEEAKEQIEEKRRSWKQQLEQEKKEFLETFRKSLLNEFFSYLREVFKELSTVELESHILGLFFEKLESESPDWSDNPEVFTVRTAFELEEHQKSEIKKRVLEQLPDTESSPDFTFELADKGICGVELKGGSRSIAWNVNALAKEKENRLEELIHAGGQSYG